MIVALFPARLWEPYGVVFYFDGMFALAAEDALDSWFGIFLCQWFLQAVYVSCNQSQWLTQAALAKDLGLS